MKTLLRVKFEIFTSTLFAVLFILAITKIGFIGVKETIFNIIIFLEIPACYIATKLIRINLYELLYGDYDNED